MAGEAFILTHSLLSGRARTHALTFSELFLTRFYFEAVYYLASCPLTEAGFRFLFRNSGHADDEVYLGRRSVVYIPRAAFLF